MCILACAAYGVRIEHLHNGSAAEREDDHEEPAGNDCEDPEEVSHRLCKSKLCNLAIKRVEVTLILRGILIHLRGANLKQVL